MHLAELLPYDPDSKRNGALRSSLKEYQALIQASIQAVDAFQSQDFEKFDSLVGENACEIRAVWLCRLFLDETQYNQVLKIRLIEVRDQIEKLLDQQTLDKLMRGNQSFQLVIIEHQLDIRLSHADFILIVSFLLSEMKSVQVYDKCIPTIFRNESAAPKNLKRYGEVSTSFGLNLISKLRKMLAAASIHFIREQAFAMQDPLLIKMVSDEFTVIHNALPCIPMFWTYKTVLSLAQNQGIPIIIHAKFLIKKDEAYLNLNEEKLLYQVDADGIYQLANPSLANLDQPACIVQGIACIDETWSKSDWMAIMSSTSVIDIILAGAADHRQYPDPALDQMFEHAEDSDYAIYKKRSLLEGFAAENPSTFFIQHVYASLASRMLTDLSHSSHVNSRAKDMHKRGLLGVSR